MAAAARTCRMGTVQRASGGSERESHSPVGEVAVEDVVAVVVVVAAAAAVGLGLPWNRAVLLLGHRPVRRLLRTWRAVEEERRAREGGRQGVFLRLPRLGPVAHNVSDATVRLIEAELRRALWEKRKESTW